MFEYTVQPSGLRRTRLQEKQDDHSGLDHAIGQSGHLFHPIGRTLCCAWICSSIGVWSHEWIHNFGRSIDDLLLGCAFQRVSTNLQKSRN